MFSEADTALYSAKSHGKNQYCIWQQQANTDLDKQQKTGGNNNEKETFIPGTHPVYGVYHAAHRGIGDREPRPDERRGGPRIWVGTPSAEQTRNETPCTGEAEGLLYLGEIAPEGAELTAEQQAFLDAHLAICAVCSAIMNPPLMNLAIDASNITSAEDLAAVLNDMQAGTATVNASTQTVTMLQGITLTDTLILPLMWAAIQSQEKLALPTKWAKPLLLLTAQRL